MHASVSCTAPYRCVRGCLVQAWAWGGLLEDMKCYAQTMEAYSVQQDCWATVQPSPMSSACKERAFFASAPVDDNL